MAAASPTIPLPSPCRRSLLAWAVVSLMCTRIGGVEFNLYTKLGLDESASKEAIMKAFVDLSGTYHPEANLRAFRDNNRKYEEMKLAFETLYDKASRKAYDESGASITGEELDQRVTETDTEFLGSACKQVVCSTAPVASGGGATPPPSSTPASGSIPPGAPPPATKAKAKAKGSRGKKGLARYGKPTPEKTAADFQDIQVALKMMSNGHMELALDELDAALVRNPASIPAMVARGTCLAISGHLDRAIKQFTVALEVDDSVVEVYRRRGQAYAAAEKNLEGAYDFQRVLKETPQDTSAMFEYCVLLHKLRDFRSCVPIMNEAVELEPENVQFWNLRGLCHVGMGRAAEAINCYRHALTLDAHARDPVVNLAQTLKGMGYVDEAAEVFEVVLQIEPHQFSHWRFFAEMYQRSGEHRLVIKYTEKALELGCNNLQSNCLLMVGQAWHTLGHYQHAIKFFQDTMAIQPTDVHSAEIAYTAFYGIEHSLYMLRNLDRDVRTFCMDRELDPRFLMGWSKKMNPIEIFKGLKKQPDLTQAELDAPKPPRPDPVAASRLMEVAVALGRLLQNNCTGFHPNKRQQPMGGFAAIELGQAVKKLVSLRRKGQEWIVKGEAASSATGEPLVDHRFGWRDAMDIVVRWRAVVEPSEQVVWVDMLTDEVFEAGFGSHTPMFKGQGQDIRYYMNFEPGLKLFKEIVKRDGKVHNMRDRLVHEADYALSEEQVQAVMDAPHVKQVVEAVGLGGFFVKVRCKSERNSSATLVGTQLVMTDMETGRPPWSYEHEFCIHTPSDPPRFREYADEIDFVWEEYMRHMVEGDLVAAAQRALHLAYYWYNLMPLARGSAMVGHVTLMGMLLGADAPITSYIPPQTQVDWEAILCEDPRAFAEKIGSWMLPPEARPGGRQGKKGSQEDLVVKAVNISRLRGEEFDRLPDAADTFPTFRSRIEAFNEVVLEGPQPRIP